jgi:hypothetical protein
LTKRYMAGRFRRIAAGLRPCFIDCRWRQGDSHIRQGRIDFGVTLCAQDADACADSWRIVFLTGITAHSVKDGAATKHRCRGER